MFLHYQLLLEIDYRGENLDMRYLWTYRNWVDRGFNWVDRELLFYKLLCNNVTGKMYSALSSLKPRAEQVFMFGHHVLTVVPQYRYLEVYSEEFLCLSSPANILAESAGRALGGIISKFKSAKNNI